MTVSLRRTVLCGSTWIGANNDDVTLIRVTDDDYSLLNEATAAVHELIGRSMPSIDE